MITKARCIKVINKEIDWEIFVNLWDSAICIIMFHRYVFKKTLEKERIIIAREFPDQIKSSHDSGTIKNNIDIDSKNINKIHARNDKKKYDDWFFLEIKVKKALEVPKSMILKIAPKLAIKNAYVP